jgi:ubiquinone/menaquinone biosynthesis C-methylase UbiE
MDVRRLAFADASFDIVASTALLEHVDGVDAAVSEMARMVRPGGVVFANFGPLYFTFGGAHYLGGFEHLWMSDEEFASYLDNRDVPYEREEALFYLRHGLFSRWTYRQYLECFRRHFDVHHVILHVSPRALAFRREHPELWRALCERYAEADLLTFAATVWLRPRDRTAPVWTTEMPAVEAR